MKSRVSAPSLGDAHPRRVKSRVTLPSRVKSRYFTRSGERHPTSPESGEFTVDFTRSGELHPLISPESGEFHPLTSPESGESSKSAGAFTRPPGDFTRARVTSPARQGDFTRPPG